jgi:hypothetical protein
MRMMLGCAIVDEGVNGNRNRSKGPSVQWTNARARTTVALAPSRLRSGGRCTPERAPCQGRSLHPGPGAEEPDACNVLPIARCGSRSSKHFPHAAEPFLQLSGSA